MNFKHIYQTHSFYATNDTYKYTIFFYYIFYVNIIKTMNLEFFEDKTMPAQNSKSRKREQLRFTIKKRIIIALCSNNNNNA